MGRGRRARPRGRVPWGRLPVGGADGDSGCGRRCGAGRTRADPGCPRRAARLAGLVPACGATRTGLADGLMGREREREDGAQVFGVVTGCGALPCTTADRRESGIGEYGVQRWTWGLCGDFRVLGRMGLKLKAQRTRG